MKMFKTRELIQLITKNLFKADLFKANLFQQEWIKLPKTKLFKHVANDLPKNLTVDFTKDRIIFHGPPFITTAPALSHYFKEN